MDIGLGFGEALISDPIGTTLGMALEASGVNEHGATLISTAVSTYTQSIIEISSKKEKQSQSASWNNVYVNQNKSGDNSLDPWDYLERNRGG